MGKTMKYYSLIFAFIFSIITISTYAMEINNEIIFGKTNDISLIKQDKTYLPIIKNIGLFFNVENLTTIQSLTNEEFAVIFKNDKSGGKAGIINIETNTFKQITSYSYDYLRKNNATNEILFVSDVPYDNKITIYNPTTKHSITKILDEKFIVDCQFSSQQDTLILKIYDHQNARVNLENYNYNTNFFSNLISFKDDINFVVNHKHQTISIINGKKIYIYKTPDLQQNPTTISLKSTYSCKATSYNNLLALFNSTSNALSLVNCNNNTVKPIDDNTDYINLACFNQTGSVLLTMINNNNQSSDKTLLKFWDTKIAQPIDQKYLTTNGRAIKMIMSSDGTKLIITTDNYELIIFAIPRNIQYQSDVNEKIPLILLVLSQCAGLYNQIIPKDVAKLIAYKTLACCKR
jgi:hypothetical protein